MTQKLKDLLGQHSTNELKNDFLDFAVTEALLRYYSDDEEQTYSELVKDFDDLLNRIEDLIRQLKATPFQTFNLATMDLVAQSNVIYDSMLGRRFGDNETRIIFEEFILQFQCYGPKVLVYVLESCKASIKANRNNRLVTNRKGMNPRTKKLRELVAKLAFIFETLGGNDSHNETSQFTEIVSEALNIVGSKNDPVSVIKRAKEQDYYNKIKLNPTSHPSFKVYKFYFEHNK